MTGRAIHQEELLQAIEPGVCLTIDELADVTALARRQITNAAMKLITRGFVERVEIGCFQLTAAGRTARDSKVELTCGPNAPRTGVRRQKPNLRSRVWRAMATVDKFTVRELVAVAQTGEESNAVTNIAGYFRILAKVGYLRQLPVREKGTALTSNGFKRYLRLRHTGPQAPRANARDKTVFDPNTGETLSWK